MNSGTNNKSSNSSEPKVATDNLTTHLRNMYDATATLEQDLDDTIDALQELRDSLKEWDTEVYKTLRSLDKDK